MCPGVRRALGGGGGRSIQLIHRAGDGGYIRAYLVMLYVLLSAGMVTAAGPTEGIRHYIFYYCFTLLIISLLSLSGRYAWLVKIPVTVAGSLVAYRRTDISWLCLDRTASMITETTLNALYQTRPP